MELRLRIAKNFRRLRIDQDLVQRKVGDLPQKTVSACETAAVDLRISTIARLAAGLGLDASELMTPIDC